MGTTVLAFILLHIAASLLLAAFGLHRLAFAVWYRRSVRPNLVTRSRTRRTAWPTVTVQLPLYNERYVAARALSAVANLDYPSSRLEIQVLDDSDDETSERVASVVAKLRADGVRIHHLQRTDRVGFKAGALAAGLAKAKGELIALFDADFVPRPDFLKKVVTDFDDPAVGMVQARWGHLNENHSLLTRAQALQLDAHFTVEHGVRAARGYFFNFNGTAGVWRRRAIEDAGGWLADTLTEDLDLSYRAQLCGWRFAYRDDVEVSAELPVEMAAYRLQQQRWAHGGAQTARKLLPSILGASLPGGVKREAAWHLLIHFAYPLLVVVTLAGLAVGLLAENLAVRWVLAVDGALLTVAMGSLSYFYGVTAQARGGPAWWKRVALVPVIMALGAGISLSQTVAVTKGLSGHRTPFQRTPKYRLAGGMDRSWRNAAYRIRRGTSALLECLTGITFLAAGAFEMLRHDVVPSGLVVLFGVGFLFVGTMSLLQGRLPFSRRT